MIFCVFAKRKLEAALCLKLYVFFCIYHKIIARIEAHFAVALSIVHEKKALVEMRIGPFVFAESVPIVQKPVAVVDL